MESLYGNAAAKTAESFDSTVLMRMLRDIYEKKFDPRTEINREMFEEVWDEFNRAVTDGYGKPAHAEPGFVRKPVMLIMTLERPVRFVNMEDCEAEIPVEIVFVLAFTDSEKHLNVLQRLSALIRDSGTAAALREAVDQEELREVLRHSELAEFWRD